MSIQEQVDALRVTIRGIPTRADMIALFDILTGLEAAEKHEYLVRFLDFFPTVKDKVMGDLLSYSNYVS